MARRARAPSSSASAAAVAAVDPSRPELDFVNRVYGLWPEDAEPVGEIAAFYRERGVRGWFELAPSARFESLARLR